MMTVSLDSAGDEQQEGASDDSFDRIEAIDLPGTVPQRLAVHSGDLHVKNASDVDDTEGLAPTETAFDKRGYQKGYKDQDDAYDVDFEKPGPFVIHRMKEIEEDCAESMVRFEEDWNTIKSVTGNRAMKAALKAAVGQDEDLIRKHRNQRAFLSAMTEFITFTEKAVVPEGTSVELLWGLLYSTFLVALKSEDDWPRIVDVFSNLKRQTQLLTSSSAACQTKSELQIEWIDEVIEKVVEILMNLIKFLRTISESPDDRLIDWRTSKTKCDTLIENLSDSVKFFNSMAKVAKAVSAQETALENEKLPFHSGSQPKPAKVISLTPRNKNFVGREELFRKLDAHLPHRKGKLRTHTLYGLRGIGKSDISIEYAYRNQNKFDVIILIRCETAAALRESFTNMAIALNLPGADRKGAHEEHLLACHRWLSQARESWLLIYDNAEREVVMEGYWPQANGAVLITSRDYYNFNKDFNRQGTTVPPLSHEERLAILLKSMSKPGRDPVTLSEEDEKAIRLLLEETEGIGLGVIQIASLLSAENASAQRIYAALLDRKQNRRINEEADKPKPSFQLDVIWSMVFDEISENAKKILGVLSMNAADDIPLDLFLPQNQDALGDFLDFCKQPRPSAPSGGTRSLATLTTQTPEFDRAIKELTERDILKSSAKGLVSIHRETMEAFYANNKFRQESFEAAARLLYEAFPQQIKGRPLNDRWPQCRRYIQHTLSLAKTYTRFGVGRSRGSGKGLVAIEELTKLFCNVAWYLLEIEQLTESRTIVRIGMETCENDKDSYLYSHLINTKGFCFFYLNDLDVAEQAFDECHAIRAKLFDQRNEELAVVYMNQGNVKAAKGELDDSMQLFRQARDIYTELDNDAIPLLVRTFVNIGRSNTLKAKQCIATDQPQHEVDKYFEAAARNFDRAEGLLRRTTANDGIELAGLQMAIAAYERARDARQEALKLYETVLDTLTKNQIETSLMLITACYKLGCVNFDLGRYDQAMKFLNDALGRAKFRINPASEAHKARIYNKKAEIVSRDDMAGGATVKEGADWRRRADLIKDSLVGAVQHIADYYEDDDIGIEPDDLFFRGGDNFKVAPSDWDDLVCGFYR